MSKVPIGVFCIGETKVNEEEVRRWLDFVGVSDPLALIADAVEQEVTNPALLIALAGKRCYRSFEAGLNPNVTRIRKEYDDYFENILASGHGSVLEHSVYNMAIENCSRVFEIELCRHRVGVGISFQSGRFFRYSAGVPYWEPESISGPDVLTTEQIQMIKDHSATEVWDQLGREESSLDAKKHITRLLMERAFKEQQHTYSIMEWVWKKELAPESKFTQKKQITSMMRRIIGQGVATGCVWSGNIRALRHVIAMRASETAEEEMLHVFSRIAKLIRDKEPMLFGDFEQQGPYWVPKYKKV